MSNFQIYYHFKLDFQKVDQHKKCTGVLSQIHRTRFQCYWIQFTTTWSLQKIATKTQIATVEFSDL